MKQTSRTNVYLISIKKKFAKSNFDNIVLNSSEKKFLRSENNIYHLSKQKVHKWVEGVASFTYVPETDEIIYVLTKQASKIFRRPVSEDAQEMLYSKLHSEKALCIDNNAEHYLIIFSETIQSSSKKNINFIINIYRRSSSSFYG